MPIDDEEAPQGRPEGEPVIENEEVAGADAPPEAEAEGGDESSDEANAEAEAEAATPTAKDDATPESIQKRINKLTREKYEERRRREDIERELQAAKEKLEQFARPEAEREIVAETTGQRPISEAELERRVDERAAQKAQEAQFVQDCNRTFQAGTEKFPDFTEARDNLTASFGSAIGRRPEFLQAIVELPNGHEVFHHLGKNLDEAARVLSLPPVKMAIEIAKIGTAMTAKPAPKQISRAAAPIAPVDGAARVNPGLNMELDDAEFARRLNEMMLKHQAAHS